jgi:hypothetical protein
MLGRDTPKWLKMVCWWCCGEVEIPQTGWLLVRFHEGVDGFLAALGADLQVVAIVREGLLAPLASLDSGGFHLGDFFEQ